MKILKKLLVRIILLILTVGIVCGSVVAVLGYFMYRDALKEQSLEDRVAEVQANPSYTTLAELPDIYLEAVVAVEDHRFRQHCGIDIIAIARATWNNIKSWSLREGGSTITQQLAKNLYFTQERSFIRKAADVHGIPTGADLHKGRDPGTVCQLHLFRGRLLLCAGCQ